MWLRPEMCCRGLGYKLFGFSSDVKPAEPWPSVFQTVTSVKETPSRFLDGRRLFCACSEFRWLPDLMVYFFARG